jgi:hypothetical protein
MAQVTDYLLSKCKALSSKPQTTKKKKKSQGSYFGLTLSQAPCGAGVR